MTIFNKKLGCLSNGSTIYERRPFLSISCITCALTVGRDAYSSRHLLQLILSESIFINDHFKEIEETLEEPQKEGDVSCARCGQTALYNRFLQKVIHLLGEKHESHFIWDEKKGSLKKFTDLSLHFAKHQEPLASSHLIEELHHLSFFLKQASLKLQHIAQKPPLSLFKESFELLKQQFKSTLTIFFNSLPHFKDDENILFFLVDQQERLDRSFGAKTTLHLVEKIFPEGIKNAEHFLLERYTARGFTHITAQIPEKFAALGTK